MINKLDFRLEILKRLENGDISLVIKYIDPDHIDDFDLYMDGISKIKGTDKFMEAKEIKLNNKKTNTRGLRMFRLDDFLIVVDKIKNVDMMKIDLKIHSVVMSTFDPNNKSTLLSILNILVDRTDLDELFGKKDTSNKKSKWLMRFFYCDKDSHVKIWDNEDKYSENINELLIEYNNKLPGFDYGNYNDIFIVDEKPRLVIFDKSKIEQLIENKHIK
jgi:hypothetical protein